MSDLVAQRAAGTLDAAVAAYVKGALSHASTPGFRLGTVSTYTALVQEFPETVLLLSSPDGAVYAPEETADTPLVEAALQRQGLRPTDSRLTLRLPASAPGAETGHGLRSFRLWATPRYRAAAQPDGGGVWK